MANKSLTYFYHLLCLFLKTPLRKRKKVYVGETNGVVLFSCLKEIAS